MHVLKVRESAQIGSERISNTDNDGSAVRCETKKTIRPFVTVVVVVVVGDRKAVPVVVNVSLLLTFV